MAGGKHWPIARQGLIYLFMGLASLIVFFTFFKVFYPYHLKLPIGCDEFGYLYMAKGIDQGKLFQSPTSRPFDPGLTNALKKSSFSFNGYTHVISPHAYHLDRATFKLINQYPPGTSLLLSLAPWQAAKRWGPAIFAFFSLVFLALAISLQEGRLSFFGSGLAVLIMTLLMMVGPFRSSFKEITSLAPTFGLLIGAGFLLDKKPGVSLLYLGLSTIFRVTGAILVLPFLVLYVLHESGMRIWSGAALRRAIKGGFLFISGGLWLYALYVWILLGNPFRPTYSFIDTVLTLRGFLSRAVFFFNLHQPWFIVHLATLALITLAVVLWKLPMKWAALAWGLAAYNYFFFLVHDVHMDYYPYASAMILAGLALALILPKLRASKFAWVVPVAAIAALILMVRFTTHKYPHHDLNAVYAANIKAYSDCFSKYDVVWGELRTGTVEYATGKAGFRYAWGTDRVRRATMEWLRGHGFAQAIWVSDLPLKQEDIEGELQKFRLSYTTLECPGLGTILEIEPRQHPRKMSRLSAQETSTPGAVPRGRPAAR